MLTLKTDLSAARLRIAELEATIALRTQRQDIQFLRQLETNSSIKAQNMLKNVLDLLSVSVRSVSFEWPNFDVRCTTDCSQTHTRSAP